MKVKEYIVNELENKGALFFAVIDPIDYASPDDAVNAGKTAYENGADAVLIGGSIGVQGMLLEHVSQRIKEEIDIPLILFPGNLATLTPTADAVYFMTLLNSRNPYWISQVQTLAAPVIKMMKIETLPVGYIVVEPGGSVGWVGDANLVPRNKPKIAAALATAAELMGNQFVLTDAGSNPANGHIPLEMVGTVSRAISVPYIVAGGIRTPEDAENIVKSGADIIQVGTMFESESSRQRISDMIKTVHKTGKSRI